MKDSKEYTEFRVVWLLIKHPKELRKCLCHKEIEVLEVECPFHARVFNCEYRQFIIMRGIDAHRYFVDREKIQDVFPYATAEDREALQSGICNPCWESTVGPDGN